MWSSLFHFGVPASPVGDATHSLLPRSGTATLEAIANRKHRFLVLEEAHLSN
jgi:hypothetical protein